jgi:hypothetical protein
MMRLEEMLTDETIATMSPEELAELHQQIGADEMDVIARIKLLAELARMKLPNTTDEDDSMYALDLLLDQFALQRKTSTRTFSFITALIARSST